MECGRGTGKKSTDRKSACAGLDQKLCRGFALVNAC